ncbi:MAG: lysylphosphatidylglycerol synthase transmembrane domain-containing protein [Acidimicrobiales bacterium]
MDDDGVARDKPEAADAALSLEGNEPMSQWMPVRGVLVRVVVVVVVLGLSGWALFRIFDDLDWIGIRNALGELSDAEWLALIFGWLVWVASQGAMTASLVDGLPVRRGVLASLGPTAVASVIPGPSDLPVRFSMYRSWGVASATAATAIGANGIFSIGSQLILPSIAGILIITADVPLSGFLSVIVTASITLAVIVASAAFVLGSTRRTEAAGRRFDGAVRVIMRRLKKPELDENLGTFLADKRSVTLEYLADKWLPTTGATILANATRFALLVMVLRFVGIPEDALSWVAVFAVYGLVAGLTAIPITPGSAGVAEIGLVGMLTAATGDGWVNQIAAGVLLYRLMTWLLVIPVGLASLGVWRYRNRASKQVSSVKTT